LVVSTWPVESTRTRSRGLMVLLTPSGATVPVFAEALVSDAVLAPGRREGALTVVPGAGANPFVNPCSPGLVGLYGIDAAKSLVSPALADSTSTGAASAEGPLSVLRAGAAVLDAEAGALLSLVMGFPWGVDVGRRN